MATNKELETTGNAVYSLTYHLIIVVKYRKKVFTSEKIIERCKDIFRALISESGNEVKNIECGVDHIHILLGTKPTTDITKLVNVIKGVSARKLRKEFAEELKDKLWGDFFWSPSYYLATTGNVSLETLMNYVNNQRMGM